MNEILAGLGAEFSDLSAVQAAQLFVRLLVAAVVGGLLGWERERAGKAAGFRTHILVAVGSAAFVAVSQQSGVTADGMRTVVQGLLAGIGFLGAGCILKADHETQVKGLTTAAGLWLTAAVGMTAGLGREVSALMIGAVGLFVLYVLRRWEVRLHLGAISQPEADAAKKGK
jgi:putative Mg2+ transporter-C (MgtC) family protein